MEHALQIDIRGIKCDNPGCGYRNEEVSLSGYEKWLNKPCPKCGSNLLTQADYDSVKVLIALTDCINDSLPKTEDGKEVETEMIPIEMNGTGDIIIKL